MCRARYQGSGRPEQLSHRPASRRQVQLQVPGLCCEPVHFRHLAGTSEPSWGPDGRIRSSRPPAPGSLGQALAASVTPLRDPRLAEMLLLRDSDIVVELASVMKPPPRPESASTRSNSPSWPGLLAYLLHSHHRHLRRVAPVCPFPSS